MDLNRVFARVRAILISPHDEWPKIGEQPETVESLYKDYLLVIMAIPAILGFLGSHHTSLIWGLAGIVARYVAYYNEVRLHSAIGYITPKAKLEGREKTIFAARDRKLAEARERRKANRQAAQGTPGLETTTAVT